MKKFLVLIVAVAFLVGCSGFSEPKCYKAVVDEFPGARVSYTFQEFLYVATFPDSVYIVKCGSLVRPKVTQKMMVPISVR